MSMKSVSPAPGDQQLAKAVPAMAFHGTTSDGSNVIGIGNLRVLISKIGDAWFAQGLEIDYAAEGATLEDVKLEFQEGLMMTLHEHIKVFKNINHALRVAPPEVWQRFYSNLLCGRYIHSNVSVQNLSGVVETLDYYEQKVA